MPMPAPQKIDSASPDLTGLDVHDIEASTAAPPKFKTPVYYQGSAFGQYRPRRRWRTRIMRWAAAASVMFGIVFFALFGEAVFIFYFPTVDEIYLRLPASPAPPRVSAPIRPVPVPSDLTQLPVAAETLRLPSETAPSQFR